MRKEAAAGAKGENPKGEEHPFWHTINCLDGACRATLHLALAQDIMYSVLYITTKNCLFCCNVSKEKEREMLMPARDYICHSTAVFFDHYAIIRVQKFKRTALTGIEIHDRRTKGFSHSNADIDFDKTAENFDLYPNTQGYSKAVRERIGQLDLKRAVRKDAAVMAQIVITSDSNYFRGRRGNAQFIREFFQSATDYLTERFGAENVISAVVHMDEKTPHLHFNFVPVTADGRLCARDVLTKEALDDLHTDFWEKVGKKNGLQRGQHGSCARHIETAELKRATASERLREVTEQIRCKEAELAALNAACDKFSENETVEVKKGLFSKQETVTLSIERYRELSAAANAAAATRAARQQLAADLKDMGDFADRTNRQLKELSEANRGFSREVYDLKERCMAAEQSAEANDRKIDMLQAAIRQQPSEVQREIVAAYDRLVAHEIERERGMEWEW